MISLLFIATNPFADLARVRNIVGRVSRQADGEIEEAQGKRQRVLRCKKAPSSKFLLGTIIIQSRARNSTSPSVSYQLKARELVAEFLARCRVGRRTSAIGKRAILAHARQRRRISAAEVQKHMGTSRGIILDVVSIADYMSGYISMTIYIEIYSSLAGRNVSLGRATQASNFSPPL